MFANNSQYQTNLNTLFGYLSSNATNPNGYHQAISSNGNTTHDTIYGHFLCRGDVNISTCQDCVATAITTDLPRTYCPNRKEAIIWYGECLVRYSNSSFFNTLDELSLLYSNPRNITGNVTQFMDLITNMMDNDIAIRAATGGSQKKFAAAYVNYTIFQMIYGMGQCTPDLSADDCNTCLVDAVNRFVQTPGRRGGRSFTPSCVARYELYPVVDLSSLPPSPKPAPTPTNNTTSSGQNGNKSSTKVIIAVVVPIVAVLAGLFAVVVCCTRYRKDKKTHIVAVRNSEDFTTLESLQYNLATLHSATNDFSDQNKLGEGGFGGVFKGTLPNGQLIAVKRLSVNSNQGLQEFKNEVLLVAKLQHRNLVRLLGFCSEGQETLLVYEYVPNTSLNKFLFDFDKRKLLDWGTCYKIIRGIARGMLYLHHDSQLRIIHRDLKASNVLLDADMNSKISDFGMARLFGVDQTQGNTSRIVGTYGYMSPEYVMHGQFSIKSDVYSFGVLILEIISGRKNNYQSDDGEDLLSFAWKKWREDKLFDFVDPTIKDSCSNSEVIRSIHIALLCVQQSPQDRPTMATVVLTLDSHSITLPVHKAPSFFMPNRLHSNETKEIGSDESSSKSLRLSVNNVSITEPEAR